MKLIHEIVEDECFIEVVLNEIEMNALDQYTMISGIFKIAGYPMNVGIRMQNHEEFEDAIEKRDIEEGYI
jgi:hypothetical protein